MYAAIHVVEEAGKLMVLGSTCFARRYGGAGALGAALHGGGGGRRLTPEERELLLRNTQELLAHFDEEARAAAAKALMPPLARPFGFQSAATQRAAPPPEYASQQRPGLIPGRASPWPWQMMRTSVAVLTSPKGQRWVRVEHQDGSQKLVPWPKFLGWETALPASVGPSDGKLGAIAVADIRAALETLRRLGYVIRIGIWREVAPRLSDCAPSGADPTVASRLGR